MTGGTTCSEPPACPALTLSEIAGRYSPAMARGGDMQEVELLDSDVDVVEQPPAPARSRRRLWWIPAGAVAVALSLVGVQLVVDAREDAAVERLAALPGVFPPLGDELEVLRRISQTDAVSLWTGIDIGGGRTAGLVVADDGSQSFDGTDQRTGETFWSTPLLGPNPERAAALEYGFGGWCQGDTARDVPATLAVCLVTDGFVRYDEDGGDQERVAATSSRVVVFDTGDGHVVAEWDTEATAQLAVLDGLVAVGTRDAERGTVVVGHDLRSGDERWRYEEPFAADEGESGFPEDYWGLFVAGSTLGIYDGATITVLSSTGTTIRDGIRLSSRGGGFGADPVTGVFSISIDGDGDGGDRTTILLAPDADPAADVTIPGELLHVTVDDGSVPGLVVTYEPHVYAWDRTSGKRRWEADVRSDGGGMVIRGRVYLTTTTEVLALDGRTGEVLWRVPLPEYGSGVLATDGRDLLMLSSEYDGSGPGGVTVLDLAAGDEIRQIPYPEGVSDLQLLNGLLAGWSYDTEALRRPRVTWPVSRSPQRVDRPGHRRRALTAVTAARRSPGSSSASAHRGHRSASIARVIVGERPPRSPQCVDRRHLVVGEGEADDVEVGRDPLRGRRTSG